MQQIMEVRDTRKRLELADAMIEYFRREDCKCHAIEDFGSLIGGLASWIRSSSLQVNFNHLLCSIDLPHFFLFFQC